MKKVICLGFVSLVFILISTITAGVSQARSRASPGPSSFVGPSTAGLPWRGGYVQHQVDPPLNVGTYPALDFMLENNKPRIDYYNGTSARLYEANPAIVGNGNCGEYHEWFCILDGIFPGHDIGRYVSWDEWTSGIYWKYGYAFYDATNRGLGFRIDTCDPNSCTHDYGYIEIPDSNNISSGLYTTLKYDSNGVPYVAYYRQDGIGIDYLIVAHLVGNGSGNCGEYPYNDLWQCDDVDWGEGIGQYVSMDISWDNQVQLAYYHGGNLRFAEWVSAGGNCGTDNWQCEDIDGMGLPDMGYYASIGSPISAEDTLDIAYYDRTNGQLKYAYPKAGGNCGQWGGWQCINVDFMGYSVEHMGISLAEDLSGAPVIAYQQIASDFSPPALRIAQPYWAFDDPSYGDCGDVPPGFPGQMWRCSTLDAGSEYLDEANFVSVKSSQAGLMGIAYSEDDNYNQITSLKYISQYFQTFLPGISKP